MLKHPLKEALERIENEDDGENGEGISEDSREEESDDEKMTVSSRISRLSVASMASLNEPVKQAKAISVKEIGNPNLPVANPIYLIQELRLNSPVYSVSASPDGQYLAVGSAEKVSIYPLSPKQSSPSQYIFDISGAFTLNFEGALDICWTCQSFLFTAGMDKQRLCLWSIPHLTPIMSFPHPDIITGATVHPHNESLVMTGCLDGRLRVWSVSEAKVKSAVDVPHPITTCCFAQSGQVAIAGTSAGLLYIYSFHDTLKYQSQIHVKSSRGKNAAGIAKVSGVASYGDQILVTSNDSRVRLYSIRERQVKAKFATEGLVNTDSQLRASVHPSGILAMASEDGRIYIFKIPENKPLSFTERLKGRFLVDSCLSIRAAIGTVPLVAGQKPQPLSQAIICPDSLYARLMKNAQRPECTKSRPYIIITADLTGRVKVFEWNADFDKYFR